MCVFVCVCVHVCVCLHTCVCVCMHTVVWCVSVCVHVKARLLSTLVFEAGSLTKFGRFPFS